MKALSFGLRFFVTVVLGAAALGCSVALLAPASQDLAGATTPLGPLKLTIRQPATRSVIYDRNGNVMTTLFAEDRAIVKLNEIPQVLIDAVLSIEDRKFYEHHGVDAAGTIRALFKNVDVGGISQGGSTITQQLVKNVLSTNRKRDLKAKAREAILAIRLENEMSKNEILEDYLNLVYFGNGAYGVEAATERYFPHIRLHQLTLADAALLAGLIQAPEALNPVTHPDAAARRRSEVLDAMVANHKISAAAAHRAKRVPLPTKVAFPHTAPRDYYIEDVKNELLSAPDGPLAYAGPPDSSGRADALYKGGLRIYTAYDPVLQYLAQTAIAGNAPPLPQFTASMVVVDNSDGGVRAIANGKPFAENQYDPATGGAGRQPGSAFKVFTLAAALSRGYSPNDQVPTYPLHWQLPPGSNPSTYNLSGDCHNRVMTLTDAIAASDNCAFTRTELSLGPGNYGADGVKIVIDMAKAMGIDTSAFNDHVVTTTLGTQEVRPIDMAQAYSVLPNDGVLKKATLVTKVVAPDGKVLWQTPTAGVRVLDQNVARTETQMLYGPVRHGTASGELGNFPRPIAGKTGTTDDRADAWFVGFTPQYTAAVWMGNPKRLEAMSFGGQGVFGGTYPARIWGQFMQAATASLPVVDFQPPDQSLWPKPSYLDEHGRRGIFNFVPPPVLIPNLPPTTTTPATLGPGPTTPPATEPPKPPKTTPPTTAPPTPPPTVPTPPTSLGGA